MTVHRHQDQTGPATLKVFLTPLSKGPSPLASSATPTPVGPSTTAPQDSLSERTEIIDMKHKHESEILKRLMTVTNGHQYEASPDELREVEDAAESKRRSERDRQQQTTLNEKRKQEQALLDQARGSV